MIRLRGIKTKNLKNIDLDLPIGCLIVISGKSGSGKSALAIDTIYAESYLRYIESISPYVRQFLDLVSKPDIDDAENLPPALSFRQKQRSSNARSIVASVSGITDYLRLLYLNIADFFCLHCKRQLNKYSSEEMVIEIEKNFSQQAVICFPYQGDAAFLLARGFYYYWEDEKKKRIDSKVQQKEVAVFVDQIIDPADNRERVLEDLDLISNTFAPQFVIVYGNKKQMIFSWNYYCASCRKEFEQPTESLFSFNSAAGACPVCNGYGRIEKLSFDLIFDDQLSIIKGAVRPLETKKLAGARKYFFEKWQKAGIDLYKKVSEMNPESLELILNGNDDFEGLQEVFSYFRKKSYKPANRFFVKHYSRYNLCPQCQGKRFNQKALAFKINGLTIADFLSLNIREALNFVQNIDYQKYRHSISEQVLEELSLRLQYLNDCGLHYLTLDRLTNTLSRGEWQRLNLTFILGSTLTQTLLVLEQPSADLHISEVKVLKKYLKRLRDNFNTLIVVDNHPQILQDADMVIELGPGSGEAGGQIIFRHSGSENSLLVKNRAGGLLQQRNISGQFAQWTFSRLRQRNLKGFDLKIPAQGLVAVIGPGGSGKSTLLQELTVRLERKLGPRKVCFVDFSQPIAAARSSVGSYFDILRPIYGFFSKLNQSKQLGLTASSFSRNSSAGQCPQCKGRGRFELEMQFLAPLEIKCESCLGTGLRRDVLQIRYNNMSIADFLQLTLEELQANFSGIIDFSRTGLGLLVKYDLGHLRLCQELKTLSSGEIQRVKIIKALENIAQAAVYVFDEPFYSWHVADVAVMKKIVTDILEAGKLLICAEHHPEILNQADLIVELGPAGGEQGGELIFAGSLTDWIKKNGNLQKKVQTT